MIHHISPERLTIERVGEIIDKHMTLALSEESITRIKRCRKYLDDKISRCDQPIYGITTGFGSLCNISIDSDNLDPTGKPRQIPRMRLWRQSGPDDSENHVAHKNHVTVIWQLRSPAFNGGETY